jgi:hypothetical protein
MMTKKIQYREHRLRNIVAERECSTLEEEESKRKLARAKAKWGLSCAGQGFVS